MAPLGELAEALKSANAGASWITFDIVFADLATYERVRDSGALDAALFTRIYGVDPADVAVFYCEPVLTIKATIPRTTSSGGAEETDFDGVQQFVPLLRVDVPG
jgi:hypothetical protein